jgi:hypothetical protein
MSSLVDVLPSSPDPIVVRVNGVRRFAVKLLYEQSYVLNE